ncbi:MAG: hypothetical protein ACTSRB_11585, partial [Candidatus Helarchaeota archaeon]
KIINDVSTKVNLSTLSEIKVFNGGSFFELPKKTIQDLKPLVKDKSFSIETRPELITRISIRSLFSNLEPSRLNVFIGFDSLEPKIRNMLLNKNIPQSELFRIANFSLDGTQFFSYIVFGIVGIPESSVVRSVEKFNELFSGTSAIEFRPHSQIELEYKESTRFLKEYLKNNCVSTDFIGEDDEEWQMSSSFHSDIH